jgi:hypothetical protein
MVKVSRLPGQNGTACFFKIRLRQLQNCNFATVASEKNMFCSLRNPKDCNGEKLQEPVQK